ncbi:uncharacterized protein METZ01_LOCUS120904 [marine metagenome]|uniref:Uncharacterized protein n=1 Tax=marine metagenome TaxID=408172 RepID=A0A381XTR7_9ZZZZ
MLVRPPVDPWINNLNLMAVSPSA